MTLHIFNPEHDIALAAHLSNFTAPHAGRLLRHDLGWLPAIWANDGDGILVDDVNYAETAYRHFLRSGRITNCSRYVSFVSRLEDISFQSVEPWGWNRALLAQLLRGGCNTDLLPTDRQLEHIRQLSHRRLSHLLLPELRLPGTIGESFVCTTEKEVETLLQCYRRIVVKAPWSSSGRGLRFLDTLRHPLLQESGWLRNVISAQGSVMVEPYYDKVKDFGMEFLATADGRVEYQGLSLFQTKNGAYTGNVLATEEAKQQLMSRYVTSEILDRVASLICTYVARLLENHYSGPFGVDMMVCSSSQAGMTGQQDFWLHPCVELNLRRTMGHVALSLSRLCNPEQDNELRRVMRIELTDHYQLKINRL